MIKQKYYSLATEHQINSVPSSLERDTSKVAKQNVDTLKIIIVY